MTLLGFDVSHWEVGIDWKNVEAVFGFTKASQGTSFVDDKLESYWKSMKDNEIIRGTYHFLDAATTTAGVAEAKHYLSVMKSIGGLQTGDLPLVLDFEGKATATGALAFVKELKKAGHKVILYCSASVVPVGWFGCDYLWVAQYGPSKPDTTKYPNIKRWTFWQSSDGKYGVEPHSIPGIGNCDVDQFNGRMGKLKRMTVGYVKPTA